MSENHINQAYQPDQRMGGEAYPTTPVSGQAYSQAYGYQTPGEAHPGVNPTEPPYGAPTAPPAAPASSPQHMAPSSKGTSGAKTFLLAFAGALVACALALGIFAVVNPSAGGSNVSLGSTASTPIENADAEASLAEAVAQKCLPSVVNIDVYSNQSNATSGNSFYDYLYGYNSGDLGSGAETQSSLGSGVILSEDGYIITNYHVVEGGTSFQVTIEGDQYAAEYVGGDASSDVAVLKVTDGGGFKAIEIADSDNISIGEWVMSIGSPFGLEQSVATGIVSATSRSQIIDASTNLQQGGSSETVIYPNMIQTDAAINPGNSGGALVDGQGQLIGINTLISSYSGNYSGVGFAIPSNYALSIAQSIIEGKEPTHAQLGVTLSNVDSSIAQRYGFTVDEGAYVSSVAPGTPAAEAGLQIGDIITEFDGQKITSASDLMLQVRTKQPGDTVTLKADRNGTTEEFEVTLGSSENTQSSSAQQNGR